MEVLFTIFAAAIIIVPVLYFKYGRTSSTAVLATKTSAVPRIRIPSLGLPTRLPSVLNAQQKKRLGWAVGFTAFLLFILYVYVRNWLPEFWGVVDTHGLWPWILLTTLVVAFAYIFAGRKTSILIGIILVVLMALPSLKGKTGSLVERVESLGNVGGSIGLAPSRNGCTDFDKRCEHVIASPDKSIIMPGFTGTSLCSRVLNDAEMYVQQWNVNSFKREDGKRGFGAGKRITTTMGLPVYDSPPEKINASFTYRHAKGDMGTITDGPMFVYVTINNTRIRRQFWKVDFDTGHDGWIGLEEWTPPVIVTKRGQSPKLPLRSTPRFRFRAPFVQKGNPLLFDTMYFDRENVDCGSSSIW